MTREDAPEELVAGQTVYLYLYEIDTDAGDPEDYLGRFPAGTVATIEMITPDSFRGLDIGVEVVNDDGETEGFSVRRDEIATSLRGGSLLSELSESIRELWLAEREDANYPF